MNIGKGTWNYIDPLEEVHKIELSTMIGLPTKPLTMICYNRFHIAFVGFNKNHDLGKVIKGYIDIENSSLKRDYHYDYFESIDSLNEYITSEDYGQPNKPTICFGV